MDIPGFDWLAVVQKRNNLGRTFLLGNPGEEVLAECAHFPDHSRDVERGEYRVEFEEVLN